ncbi:MAG: Wzz/FepE/Etk N-terminal domain-containing protein, partial [Flavobacterium sp.]
MEHISNQNLEAEDQVRVIVDQYLSYWRWFALGVIVSLLTAYIYLRYTVPQYKAASTILVKDEKKGGLSSELSAFADMGLGVAKNNLDNEVEILKSRTLIESTIRKMNLQTAYIVEGKVVSTDLYKKSPVALTYIEEKDEFYSKARIYEYIPLSNDAFQLKDVVGQSTILSTKKSFRYGETIKTKFGALLISKSALYFRSFDENSKPLKIVISPIEALAASFKSRLNVTPLSKSSSVVELSIVDPVLNKAEDFLDNLVRNYNQDAAADKNFISENTSKFIANRLTLITQELDGVEQNVQDFKKSNKLTDIEAESRLFITGSSEYEGKGVEVDIQLNMIASMIDFIKKS